MLTVNKEITIDCDFIFIELKFKYDDIFEFTLNANMLQGIKSELWNKFLNEEDCEEDFTDCCGSHSAVSIVKKNGYILFCTDTATGGESKFKLPIDKCRDAFLELAEWYGNINLY